MNVTFSGRVSIELPAAYQKQLEQDLPLVFPQEANGSTVLHIAVEQLFAGHTPEFDRKIVLAVEVVLADGYARHIVKIGQRAKVEPDYTGGRKCTENRLIGSRIIAPVRLCDLGADPPGHCPPPAAEGERRGVSPPVNPGGTVTPDQEHGDSKHLSTSVRRRNPLTSTPSAPNPNDVMGGGAAPAGFTGVLTPRRSPQTYRRSDRLTGSPAG